MLSVWLQMPEEQAFCVLVNIMYQYGLRNLFRQGFEELHLRFYQLERLIQVCPLHITDSFMRSCVIKLLDDIMMWCLELQLEGCWFDSWTFRCQIMTGHIIDRYVPV